MSLHVCFLGRVHIEVRGQLEGVISLSPTYRIGLVGGQTQVIRLCGLRSYWLSHFAGLIVHF